MAGRMSAVVLVLAALLPGSWCLLYLPGSNHLCTEELIRNRGYEAEKHQVVTEDGYILTVHRIPGQGSPIYLQHGLVSDSENWVTTDSALGYFLADGGYDVWMGNSRGSKYSRTHVKYSSSQREYWNFSFHEMGLHDLPAVIDYILERNGAKKLFYVGHSLGAPIVMVLLSERPEYNEKIRFIFTLAPAVYFIEVLSIPIVTEFLISAGAYQLEGPTEWMPGFADFTSRISGICAQGSLIQKICYFIYDLLGGPSNSIDVSSLARVYAGFPTTTSRKTFAHLGQLLKSGKFIHFQETSSSVANSSSEEYDLSKVRAPVAMFYSEGDYSVRPEAVFKLNNTIPNPAYIYKVPKSKFNHLDFVFGNSGSAGNLVYKKIVQSLDSLEMEE